MVPAKVTLGFYLHKKESQRVIGTEDIWSFFSLTKLKNVLLRQSQDEKYLKLIKVLFTIQKAKQSTTKDKADMKRVGGGDGRNVITNELFLSDLDPSGDEAMLEEDIDRSEDEAMLEEDEYE